MFYFSGTRDSHQTQSDAKSQMLRKAFMKSAQHRTYSKNAAHLFLNSSLLQELHLRNSDTSTYWNIFWIYMYMHIIYLLSAILIG